MTHSYFQVEYMQRQYEESEFAKSLAKPNVIPFPSRAIADGKAGMQSVWVNDAYGNAMGEWRERWSNMSFDMLRGMDVPWVVENVAETTQLPGALMLCGASFGLGATCRDGRRRHECQAEDRAAVADSRSVRQGPLPLPRERP